MRTVSNLSGTRYSDLSLFASFAEVGFGAPPPPHQALFLWTEGILSLVTPHSIDYIE